MTYNNKQTKDLTDFQKKKIQNRIFLDFFKELDKITKKKVRYSKIFSDQIEVLVKKFDDQGVMFYSINIELPFLDDIWQWQEIHQHIEEFLNYIGCHIELIEFCYFSIEVEGRKPIWNNSLVKEKEKEKKARPYINGLIGVRSLVGINKALFYEIKELFIISFFDIKIRWLSKCSEILKYWNSIIEQKNFKFHRFVNYSDHYPMIYGAIADEELKFEGRSAFGQENHFISDTMNISGINKKFPKKKELILYFIKLFMFKNEIFIHKNKIYSKIIKSRFSWQVIYTLDDLNKKFNNNTIFDELKLLYPQQLGNYNFITLLLSNSDFIFKKIKKDNSLLIENKIDFFDNVIEFKDGIYFLKDNKFLIFDEIQSLTIKTIYYINCYYSELDLAKIWLTLLYKNYDEKNFIDLISDLNKLKFK